MGVVTLLCHRLLTNRTCYHDHLGNCFRRHRLREPASSGGEKLLGSGKLAPPVSLNLIPQLIFANFGSAAEQNDN